MITRAGDEMLRSILVRVEKGFYLACEDVDPVRRIVVYPGEEAFPLKEGVEVMPLSLLGKALLNLT